MVMQVWLDGLQVLWLNGLSIFIFLISALGWGLWICHYLPSACLNPSEIRLPIALVLGCLVLIFPAFLLILLIRLSPQLAYFGSFGIPLIACLALLVRRRDLKLPGLGGFLLTLAVLSGLMVIRLAFLKNVSLPPYDDGPEHYAIVQGLLQPSYEAGAFYSLSNLARHYYHFGFHILAAWLSLVSGTGISGSITVLGQLFLVIFPLSVLCLAWSLTRRLEAGALAGLLTAFAWRMPAYAANWAKYPAIAGLALLPAVVGLWISYASYADRRKRELAFLIPLTLALVLLHTRTAICLVLAAIGIRFVRLYPLKRNFHPWEAALAALLTVGVILAFGETLWAYFGNGYRIPLILVAILMPFSFYRYPKLSLALFVALLGTWLAGQLPAPVESFGSGWLDRPFLGILLTIPLSVFAAGGLAGLLSLVDRPWFHWAVWLASILAILTGFLTAGSIYPDQCCDYVKPADLTTLGWIKENTPADSAYWIPAIKSRNYLVGLDAGVWIPVLTGRNANKLRYNVDWDTSAIQAQICRSGNADTYIYEGGRPYSFDDVFLSELSWTRPVYVDGEVKVYRVVGLCSP